MQLSKDQKDAVRSCANFGGDAADCADIVDKLQSHISELESEHETEMDKLKDRISELEGEVEDLSKELEALREV